MNTTIFSDSFENSERIWANVEESQKVLIIGDHSGLVTKKINEKLGKANVVTMEADKLMITLGELDDTLYNVENKEYDYVKMVDSQHLRYEILYHYKEFLGKTIEDETLQPCEKTTLADLSTKYDSVFDTLIIDVSEIACINTLNLENVKKVIMFYGSMYHSFESDKILIENNFTITEMMPMTIAYITEVRVWTKSE